MFTFFSKAMHWKTNDIIENPSELGLEVEIVLDCFFYRGNNFLGECVTVSQTSKDTQIERKHEEVWRQLKKMCYAGSGRKLPKQENSNTGIREG